MKKIIVVIFLLNSISLFSQENNHSNEITFLLGKLRINLQTNFLQSGTLADFTEQHNYYASNTFSLGLELAYGNQEKINYGVGMYNQFSSSFEQIKGDISILPVYAFIDYPLIEREQLPIQLSIRFGYAIISTENGIKSISDGLYHAFGFTAIMTKKIQMKIMYGNNYGKIGIENKEYSIRNGNFSLSLYFTI